MMCVLLVRMQIDGDASPAWGGCPACCRSNGVVVVMMIDINYSCQVSEELWQQQKSILSCHATQQHPLPCIRLAGEVILHWLVALGRWKTKSNTFQGKASGRCRQNCRPLLHPIKSPYSKISCETWGTHAPSFCVNHLLHSAPLPARQSPPSRCPTRVV